MLSFECANGILVLEMNEYKFLIANKCILIKSPKKLTIRENMKLFSTLNDYNPDLIVEITFNTDDFNISEGWNEVFKNVYVKDGEIIQRYHWKDNKFIYRYEPSGRDIPCRIGIPVDFKDAFCKNGDILNYLALERMMMKLDCYYFHSSVVNNNNSIILFSAPSHGGKSTQAKLWETFEKSSIINGDKALLMKKENTFYAFGSPIAGTSHIYKNYGAPINSIIFIKKGTINKIERLNNYQAYKFIYSQMIKSSWDQEFNTKVLEKTEQLIQCTNVLLLTCTPDKRAVDCVKEYLKRAKEYE